MTTTSTTTAPSPTAPLADAPAPRSEPIDEIEWVPASRLHANTWNPNYVARPELVLLETSILLTGWVQPVLASPDPTAEDPDALMVIDGFHRWRLATESPRLADRYEGFLPVAILDIDRTAAMLLTVRINRAKGTHGSVAMASLVRSLLDAGVTAERIAAEMGATQAEVDLLATPDVFKARRIEGWQYSPSWSPMDDGLTPAESDRRRRAGDDPTSRAPLSDAAAEQAEPPSDPDEDRGVFTG